VVQSYLELDVYLVDCLHKQEFVSFLVDVMLDIVQACICSCVGPRAGV